MYGNEAQRLGAMDEGIVGIVNVYLLVFREGVCSVSFVLFCGFTWADRNASFILRISQVELFAQLISFRSDEVTQTIRIPLGTEFSSWMIQRQCLLVRLISQHLAQSN